MNHIAQQFQKNIKDTGSSAVQIALMTTRINTIAQHIKTHAKDLHCRRGLMALISKRKSLLAYLKKRNFQEYSQVLQALGLRH